jgi:hypothetical protein
MPTISMALLSRHILKLVGYIDGTNACPLHPS